MGQTVKTLIEYTIDKFIDSEAGVGDDRKVDVAEDLRTRLAGLAKFADAYMRQVRPVALSHGYEGNYCMTLSDGETVLAVPDLAVPGGQMQADGAVGVRHPNQSQDRGGVVETPSLRV